MMIYTSNIILSRTMEIWTGFTSKVSITSTFSFIASRPTSTNIISKIKHEFSYYSRYVNNLKFLIHI
jgi:hypothetical protein